MSFLDFKPERRIINIAGELKTVWVAFSEKMQRETAPVFYSEHTAAEIAHHVNERHDFFRALPHVPYKTPIPRPPQISVSGEYPSAARK